MYEIHSNNDFQLGATLVVKIPETELDEKALYTILFDKPDFILPFHHRIIDGQIELTYEVGTQSKFVYLSGERQPDDYVSLWINVLQPLVDCGDWFMNPYSFVLKLEYLYCNKDSKDIKFVYIPSKKVHSDQDMLRNMVTDIAKHNRILDVEFENKIIWAIQDFNIKKFLEIIKSYGMGDIKQISDERISEPFIQLESRSVQMQKTYEQHVPVLSSIEAQKSDESEIIVDSNNKSDDIVINIKGNKKTDKKQKKKIGLFNFKERKKMSLKKPKDKVSLFGRGNKNGKSKKEERIIQGAAVMFEDFAENVEQHALADNLSLVDFGDDVTQLDINESDVPKLCYVGHENHPKLIVVDIAEGEFFTIGRFDVSIGVKQSDFEFDKKAKAVSRKHAVIKRDAEGYSIEDLSSAAGTIINGKKITPNVSFKLENGIRVSFGHSGADYVWNE